jgi:NADPH:quinone reductase
MKAIQAASRGGYDALRLVDISQPQPRAGQALVRVTTAGVTPLDYTVLPGASPPASGSCSSPALVASPRTAPSPR